jgi:ligand-binding sensor domain-containing protein
VRNYRHKKGDALTIRSDRIFDIAQDRHENLWIGSEGGVDYFSPTKNQCVPYLTAGSAPHWPASWMRLSLDREGVLWFGTMDGGVHWLSPRSQLFPLYALPEKNGVSPIPMQAINRDSTGMYWLLSSPGKLCNIDVNTGIVRKTIDILKGKQPSYGDWDSFIDAHGVYWYGTWGLGLFRVTKTGHVTNYSATRG